MATAKRDPEPAPEPKRQEESVLVPEEIDSSRWSMPPWGVVGIALLAIFAVIALVSYVLRPQAKATGHINEIFAVAMPESHVMTTVKLTIQNVGGKPLWIKDIKASITTDQGQFSDTAANAVDFPRYFQAYPDLREHTMTPIKVEDRIPRGEQLRGSIIVTFPVDYDQFNNRKSLSVTVEPYDQAPFTISK